MDGTRNFVEKISVGSNETETIKRCVANAHLLFKLVQVAVCFPLTKWIVKLAELIVPG